MCIHVYLVHVSVYIVCIILYKCMVHCVCFKCYLFSLQVIVTLGIIGSLSAAMGSSCSKFCKVFIPGVLGTLVDAKVQYMYMYMYMYM